MTNMLEESFKWPEFIGLIKYKKNYQKSNQYQRFWYCPLLFSGLLEETSWRKVPFKLHVEWLVILSQSSPSFQVRLQQVLTSMPPFLQWPFFNELLRWHFSKLVIPCHEHMATKQQTSTCAHKSWAEETKASSGLISKAHSNPFLIHRDLKNVSTWLH